MNVLQFPDLVNSESPASNEEIEAAQISLGMRLPQDYRRLLQVSNGFSLQSGVLIYSTSELPERNQTFEVAIYAPGCIAIGDDSGGRAIVISGDKEGVFLVDQGSFDPTDFDLIAPSIAEWISKGCALK